MKKCRCINCKHFRDGYESWDYRLEEVMENNPYCEKTSYGNLNTFPFYKIKCKYFEPKEVKEP